MKTVNTSECSECKYCTIDDSEGKARVMVLCSARNKKYFYGQRIPCEEKERKKEEQ